MSPSALVPHAGIWKPPLGRLTFGLALVVVATAFEALAVATILPVTTAELGGLALYGWTFSAFFLTNLIGITVGGSETDFRGPALPFIAGTLLFVAGLVVSGFAPSMAVIVGGRAAQGLGAGLLSAVAYASIARAYPVSLQPSMLATLASAWVLPGLLGPAIASVVSESVGWRWVFLGLAPMPVLAALLVLPALRRLPTDAEALPDRTRNRLALELAGGASLALAGMAPGFAGPLRLLLPAGLVLGIHAFRRLMPAGTMLAREGLPAALATVALINFAFFGTEAFVPLALRDVRHAPVAFTGLALTSAALAWTLGAWLPVRFEARTSRRALLAGGLVVLTLGIGATLALFIPAVPSGVIIPAWALAGLGMGVAFTTASAAVLEVAPAGREGAASASLQLAQVLGAALATGIGGAMVASPFAGDPPRAGIALVDATMLVAAAFAFFAAHRIGPRRATVTAGSGTHSGGI